MWRVRRGTPRIARDRWILHRLDELAARSLGGATAYELAGDQYGFPPSLIGRLAAWRTLRGLQRRGLVGTVVTPSGLKRWKRAAPGR